MAECRSGDCWLAVCGDTGTSPAALAEVEHRLLDLGRRVGATEVATHVVRSAGGNHHAGSLRAPRSAELAAAVAAWARPGDAVVVSGDGDAPSAGDPGHLEHAVAVGRAHRERASGRLVRFPGQEDLPGRLPLAELTTRSSVQAVDLVGVADDPGLVLRTRGHVRPEYRDGVLVLPVAASGDGEVVPFESPRQRDCCSDH
ncbi:hypothetical protein ACI8AK_05620 [Geodermatophilus sp. SYSU D00867]